MLQSHNVLIDKVDAQDTTINEQKNTIGELRDTVSSLEAELVKWKPTQGKVWLPEDTYVIGGNGDPVILVDYPTATNPTWTGLLSFLRKDTTDREPYTSSHVCADFAEELHNNAERAGIKTAYVVLDFYIGDSHAINAFQTLDKGFVYVDCTGDDPRFVYLSNDPRSKIDSWDCIAYVEEGKEYGLIDLDYAEYPFYWFWEDWIAQWNQYNSALEQYNLHVEQYNREISGKVYIIGTSEWEWIKQWEATLNGEEEMVDNLGKNLPNWYYLPGGTVDTVTIIWNGG